MASSAPRPRNSPTGSVVMTPASVGVVTRRPRVRGFRPVADRAEYPRQQVLPGRGGSPGRPRAGTRDLNGGAAATGQNLHTALANRPPLRGYKSRGVTS